jgi:hypothetical protein
MRRAALRVAQSRVVDHDDHAAMAAALNRLYQTAAQGIDDIIADLTASERARLAVFCYGRAHLNAIGLRIAALCALEHLIAASHSATAGHALFSQSREEPRRAEKPARRASITLASAASSSLAARAVCETAEFPA